MSHEEIWDDSALVESWDEAVAEYKRYHSIHARGEKIEDILQEYEEEAHVQPPNAETTNGNDETLVDNGMIVDEQQEAGIANETPIVEAVNEVANNVEATVKSEPPAVTETTPSLAPPLPPHLVGSVHDEGVKNLLMSWYYAGYYTGLYEGKGQQMAKQSDSQ